MSTHPVLSPSAAAEGADAGQARQAAMMMWLQELAPYGVVTTDDQLRVRSWNQWLAAHSGIDAAAVIGRPLPDLFPDLNQRRLDEHYHRALAGEVSVLSTAFHAYLIPLPSPVRDGGYAQMQQTVRIAPLVERGGGVLGTITIIEDVTARESQAALLRRQHDRDELLSWSLARLLENRDPLRDFAAVFERVASALGLELYCHYLMSEDGTRLRLQAWGGAVDPDRMMPELGLDQGMCGRCAATRLPVVAPHLARTDDPAATLLCSIGMRAFAGFPLLVGDRLLGTLAFATSTRDTICRRDIEFLGQLSQYVAVAVERAQREAALQDAREALRQHAHTLEARIAERTAKLNETIVQLESFTYTVAHDLRAPIRALTGYSDILLNDHRDNFPDEARGMLQRIGRASTRLDALTRDLLRFSRVSREELELTVVPMMELVHDLVLASPALQDGVVTIDGVLEDVWAQRTLLQQCISNLLDNAVKFVAPGVEPRIVVRTERRTTAAAPRPSGSAPPIAVLPPAVVPAPAGPRVRVYVVDNGIGIAAEAHDRIFGIFERVSGQHRVDGTGIGLAIVERAAQRMGGTCGVESEPGRGSRFWIELAAADAPRPVAG